jgi:hypothetical protein
LAPADLSVEQELMPKARRAIRITAALGLNGFALFIIEDSFTHS